MFGPERAEHGKKEGQPSHGKDVGGKGEERTIEKKKIKVFNMVALIIFNKET